MSKMSLHWGAIFDNLTLIHNAMGPIPPACNIPQRHWQKVGQRCRGALDRCRGFTKRTPARAHTSTST